MELCYECGKIVAELSPRSRCVTCEYKRCTQNERDNDLLQTELADLRLIFEKVPSQYRTIMRHCDECAYGHFKDSLGLQLVCFKKHKPRFFQPKSGDFTSGEWGWMRKCEDFQRDENKE